MPDQTYRYSDSLEDRLAQQIAIVDALEHALRATTTWALDVSHLADEAMRVGLAECERLRRELESARILAESFALVAIEAETESGAYRAMAGRALKFGLAECERLRAELEIADHAGCTAAAWRVIGYAECERLRAIEVAARRYVAAGGVGTAERFAELRAALDGCTP